RYRHPDGWLPRAPDKYIAGCTRPTRAYTRSSPRHDRDRHRHARLPASTHTGWLLLLHDCHRTAPADTDPPGYPPGFAGGHHGGPGQPTLSHRWLGSAAGSYACDMEPAAGRCGLLQPLAADQAPRDPPVRLY